METKMDLRRLYVAAVLLVCLVVPLAAQDSPGEIAYFIQIKPKSGTAQQFEEAGKQHMNWHRQQNDDWEWHVWQYRTGPFVGQYLALTAGHRWEDFDAKEEFMEKDQADAMKTMGPHVESVTTWFSRLRGDISNWPADVEAKFVQVVTYELEPGKVNDFLYAAGKIHQTLQKANWPRYYLWDQLIVGGDTPQLSLVLPMQKWADMNPPERPFVEVLEEILGRREAQALLDSIMDAIQSERSDILQFRPDLSYTPSRR